MFVKVLKNKSFIQEKLIYVKDANTINSVLIGVKGRGSLTMDEQVKNQNNISTTVDEEMLEDAINFKEYKGYNILKENQIKDGGEVNANQEEQIQQ